VKGPVPPAPAPAALPSAPPEPWPRLALVVLVLGAVTLLAYGNSFGAGLTLDNKIIIGQDPRIREWSLRNLGLIFRQNYWWPYAVSDLYRPVTTLSYLVNYAVLGNADRVPGYHLVNFLVHWANAALVFAILRRLTGRMPLAVLAAALFAVHPVNVESVTNLVGRADLLATLFLLAGAWGYLRAAAVEGGRKLAWLAGAGGAVCLGVLAKENAVMIAAFVVLYDALWRWPGLPGADGRARLRAAVRQWVGRDWLAFLPAAALFVGMRLWLLHNSPVYGQLFVDNPIARAGWFEGWMTAVKVIGRYLGLLVLPVRLSCDYSYNQVPLFGEGAHGWAEPGAWLSLAVMAGLLAAAARAGRRQPVFAFGVLGFFLMLLPTSNLVVPIGSIMAERFLYLPSIGFGVVAALALLAAGTAVAGRGRPWAAFLLPAVAVLALAGRSAARNPDWHDDLTLGKSAVAVAPHSFKTHKFYSNALWDAGHNEAAVDAAIARAEIGLAVLDARPLPIERRDNTLFYDLGLYYLWKGDFLEQRQQPAEARRFYQRSVDIFRRAREVDRWVNQAARQALRHRGKAEADLGIFGNHRIYQELGLAEVRLGRWAEAEEDGRYLQQLAPAELRGYLVVAAARFGAGYPDEAAVHLLAAMGLQPATTEVWDNLRRCYEAMGVTPPPIRREGAVNKLDDSLPLVRRQLGAAWVLLVQNFRTARRMAEAEALRGLAIKSYHVPAEAFGP
jgi:tetratricopeptide (TPR) repeat protein